MTDEKTLQEIAARERREYLQKWRHEHADNVREHNRRYWQKRALKKLQAQKDGKNDEQ